jgi:hypothetical protein
MRHFLTGSLLASLACSASSQTSPAPDAQVGADAGNDAALGDASVPQPPKPPAPPPPAMTELPKEVTQVPPKSASQKIVDDAFASAGAGIQGAGKDLAMNMPAYFPKAQDGKVTSRLFGSYFDIAGQAPGFIEWFVQQAVRKDAETTLLVDYRIDPYRDGKSPWLSTWHTKVDPTRGVIEYRDDANLRGYARSLAADKTEAEIQAELAKLADPTFSSKAFVLGKELVWGKLLVKDVALTNVLQEDPSPPRAAKGVDYGNVAYTFREHLPTYVLSGITFRDVAVVDVFQNFCTNDACSTSLPFFNRFYMAPGIGIIIGFNVLPTNGPYYLTKICELAQLPGTDRVQAVANELDVEKITCR